MYSTAVRKITVVISLAITQRFNKLIPSISGIIISQIIKSII